MNKTRRIEFRVESDKERDLRQAAALADESLSSFVLGAALERAERVRAEAATTIVSTDFFDALHSALDMPPEPNAALARVARRPRRVHQA